MRISAQLQNLTANNELYFDDLPTNFKNQFSLIKCCYLIMSVGQLPI